MSQISQEPIRVIRLFVKFVMEKSDKSMSKRKGVSLSMLMEQSGIGLDFGVSHRLTFTPSHFQAKFSLRSLRLCGGIVV